MTSPPRSGAFGTPAVPALGPRRVPGPMTATSTSVKTRPDTPGTPMTLRNIGRSIRYSSVVSRAEAITRSMTVPVAGKASRRGSSPVWLGRPARVQAAAKAASASARRSAELDPRVASGRKPSRGIAHPRIPNAGARRHMPRTDDADPRLGWSPPCAGDTASASRGVVGSRARQGAKLSQLSRAPFRLDAHSPVTGRSN